MKVSALVLALVALAGSSDAFLSQATSKRVSAMFEAAMPVIIGPVTGGVTASTLLPGKYGKVDIDRPWGTGSNKPVSVTRIASGDEDNAMFIGGGPVTGGVHGSTMCPQNYETVCVDNPWGGKNPMHPSEAYFPVAIPGFGGQARLPVGRAIMPSGRALPGLVSSGSTGGTEGSSMLPVGYGTVDVDDAWGNARPAPKAAAFAVPSIEPVATTSAPAPAVEKEAPPAPELPAVVEEQLTAPAVAEN